MTELDDQVFYLGIDGGATKTEAVVTDREGQVLGRGYGEGANPHNMPLAVAFDNVNKAVNEARQNAVREYSGRQIGEYEVVCLGLAGVDTAYDREQVTLYINAKTQEERTWGGKKLYVVNDGLVGFKSGSSSDEGVCLISGTGSNCYGFSSERKEALAGDWGYILGDQGSSYAMGKAILQQVMKEYDGRHSVTTLSSYLLEYLGLSRAEDLVRWTYWQKEAPVKQIAGLSKICDDVALSDLIELSSIVDATVEELVSAYKAVVSRLEINSENVGFDVVLIGGLLHSQGPFAQKVVRSILNFTPKANVLFPNKTPAEGAVRVAVVAESSGVLPETTLEFVK